MPAPLREIAPAAPGVDAGRAVAVARDVLAGEARAIDALQSRMGPAFVDAARALFECRGRVVVTGIGKSGHIARNPGIVLW